ncbi:MAG: hypothetical protein U1A78_20850 [Polyangia bacterium]
MTTQELDSMLQAPELRAVLATTEWTPDQAHRVLRAQQRSGLTMYAFARRVGIPSWRLYKWRQRLQPLQPQALAPTETVSSEELPAAFIPLQLVTPPQQSSALPSACVELVHPSGLRVRLIPQTPLAWLPLLAQALRASC